ncbi:ATP synthase subunit b, mitochondrial-like [Mizuhopecten yessoensis]|uniref:ATP synthase subunit b n=1 Tax=Mizuhopecten yessoensis TaxID=6573 RepID=A0A210QN90_MIZYE|nr:ATP synthase subunit b, mitochondrial-like [Mizuhopecten yessoensis]OWF50199.1 ATP synthase subunit b, mitochondrial [Mizuhopecten yessoensis]
MLRLRAIRAGSIARTLLGNNQRCEVEQKANMETGDFGRPGLLTRPNAARPPIPSLDERMATWKEVSDIFYGPERDLKNFPSPKQQVDAPGIRFGFVPESFFEFLYTKTGIMGPYLLLFGTPAYMFSKEIMSPDYEVAELLIVLIPGYFLITKINEGNRVVDFVKAKREELDEYWYKPMVDLAKNTDVAIEGAKTAIYQQEALEYMFDAKKENVGLQLEIEYRQRLQSLYDQARRKLDYQVANVNARKNFEQGHMARWINKAVYSSVTPQLEKQIMDGCLANLRELSKTFKAT